MHPFTRECLRLALYLVLWIVVATSTLVEVILENNGLGTRVIIALLAWFGGLVTYRLVSMLWTMWRGES